ncbi:glycosyltransferase family 4 protein [Halococcus saccharolyticus]|uniref:Glycosyl transferase group 1 n=1 Tax=Halococcus saccharolyticus DSM 5350 TaxID=1227455 RepID=M0MRW4_9EURY|nr:glycosyltransferase family 4 protein [Halococcus saccharolyticus]EMA47200.1 glycosyl transferase group 1 [Halococcus saccharolyticus DSM 5350]
MNVGLVCYGDLDTNTGGFRYDRQLVEGLRERGDHVEVIELPWRDYARGLLDGLSGRLLDRIDVPVDVIIQDELAHPSLVGLNARLRARRDVPIVAIVHHLRCSEAHSRPAKGLYRAVERRYLAGVDGAICNSEVTRATVEDLATTETVVAPPAGDRFDPTIDSATIDARARESGPLRVVFLGSLVPRKGLDTLIEGLSRLPDEHWRLRVVGSPDANPGYVSSVRRLVARLGVDDRVTFVGKLPDGALRDALGESHVLAMPSTHEGFGIAYLEGMSFGLPALATTAGGARSVVTHGETGFLLRPGDPGAVARAVRTLADDRERLTQMGTAARDCYETWPTWDETTDRVRTFLDGFVADGTELKGQSQRRNPAGTVDRVEH